MNKYTIFIILSLFLQALSDYRYLDGSRLQSLSYSPNVDYDASIPVTMDYFDQDMVSYYSWFASYGYCEDIDVPLFCCKNYLDFFTDKWVIVSETSTEKYFVYNYVLWRSDEYQKYVLAFPGTNEVLELLNEAVDIELVDYPGVDNVKLVKYFSNVAFELREYIFTAEVLADINAHPGYQIVFTGHSLGGAVATIVAYDAITRGHINPSVNEPSLMTFGQPRTGNEAFVLDFNTKIHNVFRVVRDGDIVVSLPYSLVNNPYRHLGGLILLNKDMNLMTYCPKDIGEDYPDRECMKSTSVLFKYHTYYFNPDVKFSNRCD